MGRVAKLSRRDSTDKIQRRLQYTLEDSGSVKKRVSGHLRWAPNLYEFEGEGASPYTIVYLGHGKGAAFTATRWARYRRVSPRSEHGDKLPDPKPRKRRNWECPDRCGTCITCRTLD